MPDRAPDTKPVYNEEGEPLTPDRAQEIVDKCTHTPLDDGKRWAICVNCLRSHAAEVERQAFANVPVEDLDCIDPYCKLTHGSYTVRTHPSEPKIDV